MLMDNSGTFEICDTIRVLGLSEYLHKYKNGQLVGKNAGIFNEFNHDGFQLVGHFVPRLKRLGRQYNRFRAFSFDLRTWRKNISYSPRAFDMRTRLIENFIGELNKPYDVIFQMLSLFAPGTAFKNRCYVLYTDNTFLLSRQCWPEWAPIKNKRVFDQLIQREAELLRNAACLFPYSQHVSRSMINDYDVSPEKIVMTGVSGNVPPADADTVAAHQYDRQIALFVGYEFERKGGYVLLDAWTEVLRRLPDARLIIAGPDRPRSAPTRGISWIGKVSRPRLIEIYDQATLFVMPSFFEPWGTVFNEAMSHGVPCIGTDACAMPEFIHDGTNGALVPIGDSTFLAEKLISILEDVDYAARLGRNAYQTFIENYTWKKVAERMKPHIGRMTTRTRDHM